MFATPSTHDARWRFKRWEGLLPLTVAKPLRRENQREYTGGWNVCGSILGLLGTDRALSFSGARHDFDENCTRFLVSTNSLG